MRRLFTSSDAKTSGISLSTLRWGVTTGRWQRVTQGVYIEGTEPPTAAEIALSVVLATRGVASHSLAGVLHGLDGIALSLPFVTVPLGVQSTRPGVRSRTLALEAITEVQRFRCTDGLQTLIDLASVLDDDKWEQALESALRKRLLKLGDLEAELPRLGRSRTPGVSRMRRVLRVRPAGAPPTESLLETLMVQLMRTEPQLPTPARQVEVFNGYGDFVARVDLAWPDDGVFIELDGQQHKGQPVYDARRETAVVAAMGWLPGRFTWKEVTQLRKSTTRRLLDLLEAASSRNR